MKKIIVKIDGEIISSDEYEIVNDSIKFKIAPEANAKIEIFEIEEENENK